MFAREALAADTDARLRSIALAVSGAPVSM